MDHWGFGIKDYNNVKIMNNNVWFWDEGSLMVSLSLLGRVWFWEVS